jgi:hypothetical protein
MPRNHDGGGYEYSFALGSSTATDWGCATMHILGFTKSWLLSNWTSPPMTGWALVPHWRSHPDDTPRVYSTGSPLHPSALFNRHLHLRNLARDSIDSYPQEDLGRDKKSGDNELGESTGSGQEKIRIRRNHSFRRGTTAFVFVGRLSSLLVLKCRGGESPGPALPESWEIIGFLGLGTVEGPASRDSSQSASEQEIPSTCHAFANVISRQNSHRQALEAR